MDKAQVLSSDELGEILNEILNILTPQLVMTLTLDLGISSIKAKKSIVQKMESTLPNYTSILDSDTTALLEELVQLLASQLEERLKILKEAGIRAIEERASKF